MRNGNGVHKHLFAVLAVAALIGLSAGSAFADATWLETIKVAEAGGTSINLQFGVHPSGSDAVDNGTGGTTLIDVDGNSVADEEAQPPLPPTGTFDARFSTQLILDYRAGTAPQAEHEYTINIQRAAGGDITLTWDSATLGNKVTAASMSDPFGAVVSNLDMLSNNSVLINNAAITSVTITLTSVANFVPHTQLVIGTQPAATGIESGVAMTTAPVVAAQDAGSNGAEGVTITATVGAGGGTLSGTTAVATDASGNATFSALIYTTGAGAADPETGVTLTFTATDYQGNAINVTSNAFQVAQPVLGVPVFSTVPGAAVEGTNENQTPTFDWPDAVNAVSYEFSLGTNSPDCDNVVDNAPITASTYTSARLADGSYCAKARSVDSNGTKSAYSATATFDVIPTFGEWGMIFLLGSMIMVGGYYLQRRRAGSNA